MDKFELDGNPQLTFLEIAERYLRSEQKPLSAREITTLAVRDGVLKTQGKTPWQTMKSKLSTDILTHGEASRFKRVYQGVFTLRSGGEEEYVATRFQKNKLDETIAVIPKEKLHQLIPRQGFWKKAVNRQTLARLAEPMLRRQAEETYEVIQLVSVFVVMHEGMYLTHMRSARLPESRLHGQYSMMLGGHLSIEDFSQLTLDLFSDENDLSDCTYILRELSEELILSTDPRVSPVGFIYDESRDVSRQHLGIIYLVELPKLSYEIGERGFLLNAKMESIDEIKARRSDFENWSWTLMDNVKKIARK